MPWLPTTILRLLSSRSALRLAVLAGAGFLAGCGAMDEFSWRKRNFDVFLPISNPVEVVKTSTSGSERARAIRALSEPGGLGGSNHEQDTYVTLLCHVAASDGDPLCRMAAVGMLRTYRDPRAINGLKEAYYRAGSFHSEQASVIRRLALDALGDMNSEEAIDLLVRVLKEPPSEGPDQDRDAKLQERIAAARALARFPNQKAHAALVGALASSEDIGLQRVAHESLVSSTGLKVPQDKAAWEDYLRDPNAAAARHPRVIPGEQLLQAVWWQ